MGTLCRMKEWIADGNVTIINGFYTTQCSQYTNRLTLRQLVAYFIREYDEIT
jgi:hypothetical protein